MIRIGLTMWAVTAASPKIKAPTIPNVAPTGPGTLKLDSLISSKEISISNISTNVGKGTDSRAAAIVNNSSVGISS